MELGQIYATLMRRRPFETIIAQLYSRVAGAGDLIVDGGAHGGYHTVRMSDAVGPTGLVVAFEPQPYIFGHTRHHLELEQRWNVEIHELALWDSEAELPFFVVKADTGYSGFSIRKNYGFTTEIEEIRVRSVTLDKALGGLRRAGRAVRFIKLDLEGAEFHALRGARAIMAEDAPCIVFETGWQETAEQFGYTADEFFRLFAHLDYALFDLFGRPFGPEQWSAPDIPWYLIAVERGSADERFLADEFRSLLAALAESAIEA
jgi:FkbM family methyltransferase